MGKYERSDDNVCCCDANKSGRGGLISDFVNDDRCRRSAAASSPNSDSETSIINQQDDHGSRCPKEVKEMVTVTSGPTNTYTSSAVSGMEEYVSLYKESLDDPSGFWLKMSRSLYFHTPPPNPSSIFEYNFDPAKGPVYTRFMAGATTNVSYNCIDVHVNNGLANKVALLWEGNDSSNKCEELTYGTLLSRVCRFANGLKALGVGPGDVVAIYMPMVPDIAVAMLACTRIGAVHSVIFAGYSAEWLAERLTDGKVRVLITADGSTRGNKHVQLKLIANEAMVRCRDNHRHQVSHCVVLNNCNRQEELPMMTVGRDLWWDEVTAGQPEECEPVWMDAEAPLFILYTSGSTGRPKGMVHTTAGYLLFASTVFKYSFDFRTNDVFWGTSDMGWCAAHTNILYGPLSLGGTTLLLEGPPFHPSSSRPWDVIEKYGVTQFYTAPTVIRHLMNCPPAATPDQQKLKSLRVLGSVGEPMHPQVWQWYFSVVGGSRCPIVDTYGQTETGGHLLTSVPGTAPVHLQQLIPFFGVDPTIVQSKDHDLLEKDEDEGGLAFTQPWPALARAILGDGDDGSSSRYTQSYFSHVNGAYFTGDAARRGVGGGGACPLGNYRVLGRVDDMLNVSGHLISTTQVEASLMAHPRVTEASVVAVPHAVKGQSLNAFVVLASSSSSRLEEQEDESTTRISHHHQQQQNYDAAASAAVIRQLEAKVRAKVGGLAVPDAIFLVPFLPLTRSGKVLKRILAKVATAQISDDDISSSSSISQADTDLLADPSVLPTLTKAIRRQRRQINHTTFLGNK